MKRIFFLIAIATIISCKPEKKVDYAIISGKIENLKSNKATLYNDFDNSKKIELSIAKDGSFLDTIKMNSEFYYLVEDLNSSKIYAPKGSKTHIEYNAVKKDSTLKITGNTSAINHYIHAKKTLSKKLIGNQNEIYLKEEADFKEQANHIKTGQEDLLFNTDGIAENFKTKESKNITYNYLNLLNNYELYHGYYTKNRTFKVSEGFLDELKDLELENETAFLSSAVYRNLITAKFREKSDQLIEKDSLLKSDIALLKVLATIKNNTIKNKLLFNAAKYGITYTESLETYYQLFLENSTDKENNTKIAADYKKLKSLSKGSPSPKFTDYENNAGGTMSLDDLKGSYVYIDVWATWCGPCIGEIPSLKKVEKQFHDKNIKFVSISIDTEKAYNKWKQMIVDKELGGIQLLAENAWKSQFVEDYMIKGIPRFILLDTDGNIINANAPRPSDEKLITTLKSLQL